MEKMKRLDNLNLPKVSNKKINKYHEIDIKNN